MDLEPKIEDVPREATARMVCQVDVLGETDPALEECKVGGNVAKVWEDGVVG